MDARAHAQGVPRVLDIDEQNRKFVAAETRQRVVSGRAIRAVADDAARNALFVAQGVNQAIRHRADELIADGVAQAVIHDFEVIQIDEEHGELIIGVALGVIEGAAQAVEKQRAIGQIGQDVVEGIVGQTLLGALTRRNVAAIHHQALNVRIAQQIAGYGLGLDPARLGMLKSELHRHGLSTRLNHVAQPAFGQGGVFRVDQIHKILVPDE